LDSLDAGLKQWIIIGISIAASIALPGIGGILIGCVLDGTFINMFTAVAIGNWAMLGLSLACMVPGAGKLLKGGIKAAGKGMTKTTIKKGTLLNRVGGKPHSMGKSPGYTTTNMKGLSRQEIKIGTNLQPDNAANKLYIYKAKKDFKAKIGYSKKAGVFEEVQVAGNDEIMELVETIDLKDANLYYYR